MNDLTRFDTGDLDSVDPDDGEELLGPALGGRAGSLVDFLYPTPAKRNPLSILAWWEKRRLPYNLFVGTAGTLATGVFVLFAMLPPFGTVPSWQIIFPIVVFGVMANVCYTLGSIVEIAALKIWGRDVLPIGPALYRMGLTFSVGLALLPALLILIIWIARIVFFVV